MLGAALSWVSSRGLIDDSYITLAYARNLAEHGHWGMTPGITSNAATSPLNVGLLALGFLLARPFAGVDGELALGVVTTLLVAVAAGCAGYVTRRAAISPAWAVAGLVVVLANPLLVSALGLEVVLLFTAMTALLAAGLAGRPVVFGVVAGLALLARLDTVVFIVVLALACHGVRRRLPSAVLACCVVALPWFAASWYWLGSAIPDTFVIKTNQKNFGPDRTYLRGLWTHYWPNTPVAVGVGVAGAAIGVLVLVVLVLLLVRRRDGVRAGLIGLGVAGALYFGVYSVLGVPPYQWYYVPPAAALSFVAVLGLGVLLRDRGRRVLTVGLSLAAVAGLGFSVPAAAFPLPWAYPPVFGNFATPAEYHAIGARVGRIVGDERVQAPGEIGELAYSCDCEIVDQFSDPAVLQPLIDERIANADPVLARLLTWNYARRDPGPAQPTPWVLRWRSAAVKPPQGVAQWTTTAGTWRTKDELVLFRAQDATP
ncbi:uncharacterized protein DUF2029 [Kineococcus rhizosphaerae]|uniref:Uncharacterized protein DUF2029 n=1 Tax=Kineococcus rhizosphaerae TaxID=559628 RepID=A0A2T0RB43_9ACTN|nr:uncharacterized protein DUF2029 [Kineococcus rhizosphaerae]